MNDVEIATLQQHRTFDKKKSLVIAGIVLQNHWQFLFYVLKTIESIRTI